MIASTPLPFWMTLVSRGLWKLPIRGRLHVVRMLVKHLSRQHDVRMTIKDGIHVVVPSLSEPIGQELLAYGRYEEEVDLFLRTHLTSGSIFLDVGANIGLHSARASQIVGPNGRVIAVEASPRIYQRLRHTVEDNNLLNVETLNVAATDGSTESLPFWDAPPDHFGMGALVEQYGKEPVQVPTRSIDNLLRDAHVSRIDVMKVDVEGFESGVFQGARELLKSPHAPIVIFEVLDWAERRAGLEVGSSQRILQSYGYDLYEMNGRQLKDPIMVGGGNIWARPRRQVVD